MCQRHRRLQPTNECENVWVCFCYVLCYRSVLSVQCRPVCPECVCLWPQKVHNSLPFLFSFLFLTFVMESWTSGAKTKFQSSTCLFSVQNQPVSNTGSSCFSLPCCPDPWPPLNRDLRGATWQTKAVITNTNQVQLRDYHWSTGSSTEVQWAGLSDLSDIFCVF